MHARVWGAREELRGVELHWRLARPTRIVVPIAGVLLAAVEYVDLPGPATAAILHSTTTTWVRHAARTSVY